MGVGLVLGGGGVVGVAWETGVLAGLAGALGWDPASSPVLVGTSAGSIVGAQLLHGRTLDELVAAQRDPAPSQGAGRGVAPPRDPEAAMEVFRLWGGAEEMDAATARAVGAAALRATGQTEEQMLEMFERMLPSGEWPDADLRVTAVAVETGERVVCTPRSGVSLVRAVAASCAVPGLFPPVSFGEDGHFLDGGLWSGSNADVLAGSGVDAAVFVGPMSAAGGGIGELSARSLEREVELLAAAGIELHTVVPGARFAEANLSLMDATRRAEALEIGLAEGAEAAGRLGHVLS